MRLRGRPLGRLIPAAACAAALVACGGTPRKKLVEWGWDEPDTAFLRQNLRAMEDATPFDGCVFGARVDARAGGGSFSWRFFGRQRFDEQDLSAALADLRALRPHRFGDSFLRVNVTPGDLDWFDDFAPVRANARLAGLLARAGRARGVVIDTEQYQGQPFDYARQPHAASRSWNSYAAQARVRGGELMAALQEGYPGLTVLLSFGHSLPWVQTERGRRPLAQCSYGLLAPFLDGLLDAARGTTRVVDGYELSYGFREPQQFEDARRLVSTGVLPLVGAREAYRTRLRLGFGIWVDYDWRRRGWSATDPARNDLPPEALERVVTAALRSSDEYVWVYAETPRWWGATSAAARMPAAYDTALRRAKAAAAAAPAQ